MILNSFGKKLQEGLWDLEGDGCDQRLTGLMQC